MRLALAVLLVSIATLNEAHADTAAAMARLNVVLPRVTEEELAVSAAPEHLRAGATVYVYGERGYERVRSGTNGFTCLVNRDGFFYGGVAFKPTCWDSQGEKTYVPVMLKVGSMLAAHESFEAIQKAIDAGFANGTFHAPETGGVAYMLAGDVELDTTTGKVTRQIFPGHYMFYPLGVTNAQLGVTREAAKRDPTLPSVFSGGAGGQHGLGYLIAVPGHAHTLTGQAQSTAQ